MKLNPTEILWEELRTSCRLNQEGTAKVTVMVAKVEMIPIRSLMGKLR